MYLNKKSQALTTPPLHKYLPQNMMDTLFFPVSRKPLDDKPDTKVVYFKYHSNIEDHKGKLHNITPQGLAEMFGNMQAIFAPNLKETVVRVVELLTERKLKVNQIQGTWVCCP